MTDAGMPSIADPGYLVVKAAIDAGDPGRGHSWGICPNNRYCRVGSAGRLRRPSWDSRPPELASARGFSANLLRMRGTLVFFESPHRLRESLEALLEYAGRPTDCRRPRAHQAPRVLASRICQRTPWQTKTLPEKGEFTIVVGAEIRELTGVSDVESASRPSRRSRVEFGELTENIGLDRREAFAELARRHRLPKRAIYSLIERGKKSG